MMCSEATAIKIVLEKRKIIAAMLIHAKDFRRIIASISLSQQQVNSFTVLLLEPNTHTKNKFSQILKINDTIANETP